jgi:hypothetical protein
MDNAQFQWAGILVSGFVEQDDSQFSLASILLSGFVEQDQRGRWRRKYLRRGAAEHEARRELAELLRSNQPLSHQLRQALASLFDPDQEAPVWQQRGLKIVNRRRGKLIDHMVATEVLAHVVHARNRGLSVNAAIDSAAAAFSISDDMAKRIWRRYRRAFGDDLFKVV